MSKQKRKGNSNPLQGAISRVLRNLPFHISSVQRYPMTVKPFQPAAGERQKQQPAPLLVPQARARDPQQPEKQNKYSI